MLRENASRQNTQGHLTVEGQLKIMLHNMFIAAFMSLRMLMFQL